MVDLGHRRQGLFTRMTERSLEWLAGRDDIERPFCYNYPNENFRPGYLKLGWRVVSELTTYYWVENLTVFLGDDDLIDRIADLTGRGYLRATRVTQHSSSGVSVEQRTAVLADTLASLYERAVPATLHVHRTPEFYRWRLDNPNWEYTMYVATHDTRPAVGAIVGVSQKDGATVARLMMSYRFAPIGRTPRPIVRFSKPLLLQPTSTS